MNKIIQITGGETLYCLTEDGKVYYYGSKNKEVPFEKLSMLDLYSGCREKIYGWIELVDEINSFPQN